jgi:hypothetical protein
MQPAFPTSDYYEGSAPPRGQQPTASLPTNGGQPQDGSHVHRRSIDGDGAQLCPCSLATSTPQTFLMASAPATKYQPRSRQPTRASVHCVSAHIRQVGADAALKGVRPLVRSRYTFPSRLPDPDRLAVPARPVVVGAAPTRALRFQGQAAPSFNDPLRRAAVEYLNPLDHRRLVAHYVLAAQSGRVAGAATEKHGLAAHRPKRPAVCVLPEGPCPGSPDRTHGAGQSPQSTIFMPRHAEHQPATVRASAVGGRVGGIWMVRRESLDLVPIPRLTPPGATPTIRLNARANAASDR